MMGYTKSFSVGLHRALHCDVFKEFDKLAQVAKTTNGATQPLLKYTSFYKGT